MLDKNTPAGGSTRACTAIIQYELDTPLRELVSRIGLPAADLVTKNCRDAVKKIYSISQSLPLSVKCFKRPSLYIASTKGDAEEIRSEYDLKKALGLDCELLDKQDIAARYPWEAPLGLYHHEALELDPVELTLCLLEDAVVRGLRLSAPVKIRSIEPSQTHVTLKTNEGTQIRCSRLIIAAGYETYYHLPKRNGKLSSSYAAATAPNFPITGWHDHAVVWETARPYHYLRRTADERIIIGGRDKPFQNEWLRDLLLPLERFRLREKLRGMMGNDSLSFSHTWCGTFAESDDGMPFMGAYPNEPKIFHIFASGENGVTFAALAPQLVGAWIANAREPLQELFSISREA